MIEDDRDERRRLDAPVFEVAPVARRSALNPRLVLIAVVAVAAFVGGLAVASGGPAARSGVLNAEGQVVSAPPDLTDASPAEAGATRPPATPGATRPPATPDATPDPRPLRTAAPGSSAFVAGFDPGRIIAAVAGGTSCEAGDALGKEVPRTRADGPRMTFQRSWLVYCTVPPPDRQSFLIRLFKVLKTTIPAETFAYGTTLQGAGDALFPYAERPMAGTLALHADAAGKGLAIVVILEEWRTD